jgi:hypothetical protein
MGMRPLLGALIIILCAVASGCGSSQHSVRSASDAASQAPASATAAATASVATVSVPAGLAAKHYLADGDRDPLGDEDDDNSADRDHDPFLDYKKNQSRNYHDNDDREAVLFGHPAGAVERRTITAVVLRYYAAAATGDVRKACSLLPSSLVRALPVEVGRLGPRYLRGGRTCEEILTRLFRRHHPELAAPINVTEVRVRGDDAFALLGSKHMPASFITPKRIHGVWTTDEVLGVRLP